VSESGLLTQVLLGRVSGLFSTSSLSSKTTNVLLQDMSEMLQALSGAEDPPNVFVMADRGPETCNGYIARSALPNQVRK
jgi:hypothetical protein